MFLPCIPAFSYNNNISTLNGIRIRVSALRTQNPKPLDDKSIFSPGSLILPGDFCFVQWTGFEPAVHLRDKIESLGALSNLHTIAFVTPARIELAFIP